MPIPDFQSLSLWTNVAIFAAAAVVVWIAGTRLAAYADAISERTQVSRAFLGLILLGVATSLPVSVTLERRDRTFLRMGYDSLAVLIAYFLGLVVLWQLR